MAFCNFTELDLVTARATQSSCESVCGVRRAFKLRSEAILSVRHYAHSGTLVSSTEMLEYQPAFGRHHSLAIFKQPASRTSCASSGGSQFACDVLSCDGVLAFKQVLA